MTIAEAQRAVARRAGTSLAHTFTSFTRRNAIVTADNAFVTADDGIVTPHNAIYTPHNAIVMDVNVNYAPDNDVYMHDNAIYTRHNAIYMHDNDVYTPHNGIVTRVNDVYTPDNDVYKHDNGIVRRVNGLAGAGDVARGAGILNAKAAYLLASIENRVRPALCRCAQAVISISGLSYPRNGQARSLALRHYSGNTGFSSIARRAARVARCFHTSEGL